jgi:hypothetical protein
MKNTLILLSTIFLSFTTFTDHIVDQLGVKGPLEFNKTNFNLASAQKVNENYYIQEYLPDKEVFDSFDQLLTIHLFLTSISPDRAAKQKLAELTERKKTDPICNYQTNQSPDGKEVMVDFLLGESKDNKMTIAEFNVYRYKQIDIGKNEKAIFVYAYSKRAYGADITAFLKNLKADRIEYLNQMIVTEMPKAKIKK